MKSNLEIHQQKFIKFKRTILLDSSEDDVNLANTYKKYDQDKLLNLYCGYLTKNRLSD